MKIAYAKKNIPILLLPLLIVAFTCVIIFINSYTYNRDAILSTITGLKIEMSNEDKINNKLIDIVGVLYEKAKSVNYNNENWLFQYDNIIVNKNTPLSGVLLHNTSAHEEITARNIYYKNYVICLFFDKVSDILTKQIKESQANARYFIDNKQNYIYIFSDDMERSYQFSGTGGVLVQSESKDIIKQKLSSVFFNSASDVYIDKTTGMPTFTIAYPLFELTAGDTEDSVIGVLYADFDRSSLRNLLNKHGFEKYKSESYVYVNNKTTRKHLDIYGDEGKRYNLWKVDVNNQYEIIWNVNYLDFIFSTLSTKDKVLLYLICLIGVILSAILFYINLRKEINTITDELTGCYNRKVTNNYLLKKDNCFIVFIDCDKFKLINDTMGHEVGDQALIYIVSVINERVASSDILVRYGGDEFVLFCKKENSSEIQKLMELITAEINKFSDEFILNISYGIAYYDGRLDIEYAIKEADANQYIQKRKKR